MDSTPTVDIDVAVIGAGPAGLAVGASLRQRNIPGEIFERADRIAPMWHGHYRRLHLHTPKESSGLPYRPFPAGYPRYPSRQQVVNYLEDYAAAFALRPRFGETVTAVRPLGADRWEVITSKAKYIAGAVVMANGLNGERNAPAWPEMNVFRGRVVHSGDYVDGDPFRGQRVLVVGFGNSGAEIAIDLWEHGATPSISVRSPTTVIPRDLGGIPIVKIATLFSFLPAALVDFFFRPILRVAVGDLRAHGIRSPIDGPMMQIATSGRVPVLDVGTVGLIKQGKLKVMPGIQRVTEDGIIFENGSSANFDAIILATGRRRRLDFLKVEQSPGWQCDPRTIPAKGRAALPNLYFCGFHVPATGMLREIAIEAEAIAARIANEPPLRIASAPAAMRGLTASAQSVKKTNP